MAFDKCELSRIVADIFFNEAVTCMKNSKNDEAFERLIFAEIFYTFCENPEGMKKCRNTMDYIGMDTDMIKKELRKNKLNPMVYARNRLDKLKEDIPKGSRGNVPKEIILKYF